MKIGLLAYSTNTGLGYQTLEFYRHIPCAKVLVVDLTQHNHMPTHHDWYPNAKISTGFPSNEDCQWLVDDMDVVFICETPLNHHLIAYAKEKGVKIVNQYNYEFLGYLKRRDLPTPTVLAAPSKWGIDHVKSLNLALVQYWPVPVNTELIKYRKPSSNANSFIHILGRPTANDRNGTIPFLEAAILLGKKYYYKIFMQTPTEPTSIMHFAPIKTVMDRAKSILGDQLEIIENVENNADMFKTGDVMVLPRRYGGLCLPMWEALSAGMPVIMPNISPNYTNLPKEWLVESELSGTLQTATEILLYSAKPDELASKMLSVAQNIKENNLLAHRIASKMSWENQAPIYMDRFIKICAF